MKSKLMLCGSAVLLSACGAQSDDIPNPSTVQEQAATSAYTDLRDGEYDKFLAHLEPELQRYFQDNQKVMRKFSHAIPKEAYKSKTLMVKQLDENAAKGSEFKVSYEIAYPQNLVQYDVSFDRPNGSTQIKNLNIRVFGE